jgi:hypothetical protein
MPKISNDQETSTQGLTILDQTFPIAFAIYPAIESD